MEVQDLFLVVVTSTVPSFQLLVQVHLTLEALNPFLVALKVAAASILPSTSALLFPLVDLKATQFLLQFFLSANLAELQHSL